MSSRSARRKTDADKSPGGPLRKRPKKADPIEIVSLLIVINLKTLVVDL